MSGPRVRLTAGERVGQTIAAHAVASVAAALVCGAASSDGSAWVAVPFAPVALPIVVVAAAFGQRPVGVSPVAALLATAVYAAVGGGCLFVFSRPDRRPPIVRPGVCPACGYDLRATPGRCPECGAAAGGT